MANELRRTQLSLGGYIENDPLASGGTTLNSAALAAVTAGIGSTEHMALILDPDGDDGAPEIVYITALTGGATSATIARAQEGTTARAHNKRVRWVNGLTERDVPKVRATTRISNGDYTTTSTTRTPIDATNLAYVTMHCEIGDLVRCHLVASVQHATLGNGIYTDFEVDQPTSANVYVETANDSPHAWGCQRANTPDVLHAMSVFTVTERGTHGFRPVWFTSSGTATMLNASSGSNDAAIKLLVENLGAPRAS